MKHLKLISLSLLTLLLSCGPKQGKEETEFGCGQMIGFEERLKSDPVFAKGLQSLEIQTSEYQNRLKEGGFRDFRATVVTIPVVVHVVYENALENISDAKIQSQIAALNNFFRRQNSDLSSLPAPFIGLAADAFIEFKLAQRDPNCLSTTGITRTATTLLDFMYNPNASTPPARNPVKFNSSGGHDGWPPDRYLNIWVCDLDPSLRGYGSFPSDLATRPTEDGIVIDYLACGTIQPYVNGYHLGRICAHEVGHWLNLRHIWGDDCPGSSQCNGTDYVGDTPNQECANNDYPTFPKTDACTPTSPGVMFYNQMDYTKDLVRRMITQGQCDRMAATLFTVRNNLLGSQGAIPPPVAPIADLWIKDTDADIGNEPNNESSLFYLSDDIWIRNTNDGLINQESQNAQGGGTNYVYVRVRNKGCTPSATGATLRLYWAKASSGLSWMDPWDGSVVLSTGTLMGNENPFVAQTITSIPGNGTTIFEFQWTNTPDPSDYATLVSDLNHFCLLARIEETTGMTFPEVIGDLWGNVKKNNNIAWKNIAIEDTDGSMFTGTLVSNYTKEEKSYKITIDGRSSNRGLYEIGTNEPGMLFAKFDEKVTKLIENNSIKLTGFQKTNNGDYLVENQMAEINGLTLAPIGHFVVSLKFVPSHDFVFNRYVYEVLINQLDNKLGQLIGGQSIRFKINEDK